MSSSQRVLWKRNKDHGWALRLALLGLLLKMGYAQAEVVNASLHLGAFEHSKDVSDEGPVYPASLWVTVKPELPAAFNLYAEGLLRAPGGDHKTASEIRELYLERSVGPVDLKVGRQIIVWGRADKINPTDSLSTRDFQRLSSDDEEQRLGLGAAQAALNMGDYRLIGVWQYEWRNPIFPALERTAGVQLEQEEPDHPARQGAIKLDHTGGAMDWSLSAFRGYNRTPSLSVQSLSATGLQLALQHDRVTVVGGDVAFNAGDIGWRGEIAHTWTSNGDAMNPLAPRDFTAFVWGGDRNLIENLNLNAQYFARSVEPDHAEADPLQSALRKQMETNAQQRYDFQDGLSLRLNGKLWQETLEWETAWVWNHQDGDNTLRPKVTYAWNDHVKTIVGSELNRGPRDSFFGQLKDAGGAYVELRASF